MSSHYRRGLLHLEIVFAGDCLARPSPGSVSRVWTNHYFHCSVFTCTAEVSTSSRESVDTLIAPACGTVRHAQLRFLNCNPWVAGSVAPSKILLRTCRQPWIKRN